MKRPSLPESPLPFPLLFLALLVFAGAACQREEDTEILRSPESTEAGPGTAVGSSPPMPGESEAPPPVAGAPQDRRPLSAEEQAKVIDLMMNRLADRQSRGLGSGKVTVNDAWQYDGYSYLSPNPASEIPARMVAVDLTVEGHTPDFDPDDIEIVDGITQVSYGSDPHLTFLKGPGEPVTSATEVPDAPLATRMLLIYAFPKDSKKFTLYYWGKNLLTEPRQFSPSGWGLPYPEKTD